MSNNLSIRHLRAFVAVARHGSFTRAAEHLHLTQSSLTATIKQLEQQSGLVLLDRTTRRVLLNAEGERFLPVAERLLSDFDTAVADLQAVAEHQQGQVGIAASPSTISRLLPPVVKRFHDRHPQVGILLRDHSAAGIEQHVLANDVDFGIGGNHSDQPDLSYTPILRDRFGVVLAPDHPLARENGTLDWQALAGEELLMLSTDTGIRAQLSRYPARQDIGLQLDRPTLEVSNPAGLAALVEAGMGLSVLPALAAGTRSFASLHFRPLANPALHRDLYIIRRRGRSLSPAADSLLAMVRETFSSMTLPPFVEAVPDDG
ncbi:LysR family transcriptional regulator [Marinobacterium nitratireducens]|uniref:LysR family transcriptional regulator n=1 Tax=Marinobacterium nitratireducens TaxID=518897 RepID=A0A917ZPR5_9GAMM|nr:LysR family transcriptional regulator [Marinobacterium nitratireducens]GGO87135.1 LysR family transcriptional regulator [Marinobacterium nitratireducens]